VSLALVSFDIDGTLECGQPPGVVPLALVSTAKQLGYLVGSCSDRPIAYQRALWDALGIAVDFTVLKHRLGELKARFAAAAYYHVGDADADARCASDAGFRFLKADAAGHAAWAAELFGTSG
jgi:phosphoglycolate phosphatase-like HAD superfamily hydrolase